MVITLRDFERAAVCVAESPFDEDGSLQSEPLSGSQATEVIVKRMVFSSCQRWAICHTLLISFLLVLGLTGVTSAVKADESGVITVVLQRVPADKMVTVVTARSKGDIEKGLESVRQAGAIARSYRDQAEEYKRLLESEIDVKKTEIVPEAMSASWAA